jgi:uroporphyrinogen-III decarboxylase
MYNERRTQDLHRHPILCKQISKKCQDTIAYYLKIFIILYADDTVILSESAEGLQEALSAFEKYCNIWKLTKEEHRIYTDILFFVFDLDLL